MHICLRKGGKISTHTTPHSLPRSFLYVPASAPELFPKARKSSADALILDLEDSVSPADKPYARDCITQFIRDGGRRVREPQIWIRVSADSLEDDLNAAFGPAARGLSDRAGTIDGVILAKCDHRSLASVDSLLEAVEHSHHWRTRSIPVVGLIEDAGSLLLLSDLSKHPRLLTFGIGEVDLLADLRMDRTTDTEHAVNAIRLQFVIQCAAAKLAPPVAPTSTNFRDSEEFARTTRMFSSLGFRSRTAIHPSQISIINDALTPSAEEITEARDVIARLEGATSGVAIDAKGRMIDEAVVRSARELLTRAEQFA